MRTNKSQFAEYECSPTASSFVFIAGRRAATEVELSSSGRREGVRRLAAPTDTSHSSPVDLGESHLQGVALITRAWGITTELLCIVCLHLSGATSLRIYSNAFFVLAAAAEQCGSFFCMAVAQNPSTELVSSNSCFPPDRSQRGWRVLFWTIPRYS